MTVRLYYDDATLLAFDADVVRVEGDGLRVELDRSAFYPSSGGQPHDTGTLDGIPVTDVVDDGARVVHVLARPLAAGRTRVAGRVDAARRLDHMQQHTAQHLLSAILEDECRRPTVSFHLGAELSTIDLDGQPLGAHHFAELEARLFRAIGEDRAVTVASVTDTAGLRLRKPTERTGPVRIVTIDGLDVNACGGTHLASTGQLGLVLLLGTEKVKQGTRLSFVAGGRALAHARHQADVLAQLSATFGCAPDEVPGLAAKQRDLLVAAEKMVRALTAEVARREGAERYAGTAPDAAGRRVMDLALDEAIDDRVRATVQAFVAGAQAVALVTSAASRTVLLAASADGGLDAGAVLKPLLAAAGGKGGGSAAQAQGSVPDAAALAAVRAGVHQALGAS